MNKQNILFYSIFILLFLSIVEMSFVSADLTITGDTYDQYSNPHGNYYNSSTNSIIFGCTATTISPATIDNISLWINGTLNETITGLTLESESVNFYKNISEGTFNWTCSACDNNSICSFADNNTLTIDTTFPSLVITSPTSLLNYGYIGMIEILSWIVSDIHLSNIYYNYNGEYTCGRGRGCGYPDELCCPDDTDKYYTYHSLYGAINSTTFILNNETNYLTLYASDYAGNINSTYINWSYETFGEISPEYSETGQAVYSVMDSAGAGLGMFMSYMSQSLSKLLISLGFIVVVIIIGWIIAITIKEEFK